MNGFLRDMRLAARSLRKSPGFTAVAVATMALGIGANTAIFSAVHAALLRRLPFHEAGRLVYVWESAPMAGSDRNVVNPGNYIRWKERSRSFASLAAMTPWTANLSGEGDPLHVRVGYVSGNFFPTLGGLPLAGRLLQPSDGAESSPDVVVISAGLWRRRFGNDPALVGKVLRVNGVPSKVVGIAADRFDMPAGTDIWVPMAFGLRQREAPGRYLSVIGRLRDGVSVAQSQHEMTLLAAALQKERPDVDSGWSVRVVPLREQIVGNFRVGLTVLMAAVGCLLLIGCANLANLVLARVAGRRRELAIRTALGATRGQIARVLLAESALLTLAGGAAGGALGILGVRALVGLVPADLPNFLEVRASIPVLLFTAGVSILVGILFGLYPALRTDNAELRERIHGTDPDSSSGSTFSRLLIAFEVAGCVVLLSAAGLLLRSLAALWSVDPGFRIESVLSFRIDLPSRSYPDPQKIASFSSAAENKLRSLAGVTSVGAISWLPLGGPGAATSYFPADRPAPTRGSEPVAEIRVVTPGFFPTAGVPLLRGRLFGREDDEKSPLRAVVNAELVRRSFGGGNPIGRQLSVSWGPGPEGERVEVVGVVADSRLVSLDAEVRPVIFFSQSQQPNNFMTVLLRGSGRATALVPAIRESIRTLDPELPVADIQPMNSVLADSLKRPRFFSTLLGLFATLALLLAAVGVYGTVNSATVRRTREVGIRMALGARPADIVRAVVAAGMVPVAFGAAAGFAGALATGRLVRSLLFATAPMDPLALVGALALLGAAALLACGIPARRASRLDALAALRNE